MANLSTCLNRLISLIIVSWINETFFLFLFLNFSAALIDYCIATRMKDVLIIVTGLKDVLVRKRQFQTISLFLVLHPTQLFFFGWRKLDLEYEFSK